MSATVTPVLGSTSVSDLYATVCFVLLEDFGLVLQSTPADFLGHVEAVYGAWLERTALAVGVHTQMGQFAGSQYPVPEEIMGPAMVFYNGKFLPRSSQRSLDQMRGRWQDKTGEPQVWQEDGLAPSTIAIASAPQYQGDNMAPTFGDFFAGSCEVSIVGPLRPSSLSMTLGTVLDLIPDSFTCYLAYGVLERMFSQDGEMKDSTRAEYCRARVDEGTFLAVAITGQDIDSDDVLS